MKISAIISACDGRENLFEKSLRTYCWQTLPKNDFEIIIVDDGNRNKLYDMCKTFKNKINFQYIKVDKAKSFYKCNSFTPALTNNIGFNNKIWLEKNCLGACNGFDFYHFGASIKDLGTRGFMFSKIEEPTVINALNQQWSKEWDAGTLVI